MNVYINYEWYKNAIYYNKTDVSKGIDVNKISDQKSVIFVTTVFFFQMKGLSFKNMYAIYNMIY